MSEHEKTGAPCLSRRTFLGAAAAAGATAATMAPWSNVEAEIARLKDEGWTPHPVACNMCGGYCGMLAMHKDGTEPSFDTVRIYPNPSHPQRGYCARGSSAMYVWNSPIRLKKPMKRTGERGEGKFVEVSWDEALNDIAKRVKEIVEKHGEHAVAMTSHNFSALQNWFGFALGTPNIISHSSTCNSASVMGRRLVLGKGFDGAGKVEPDYANCRYLLLIGRTLNCAMGVQATFAEARKKGCRVVFVDPRMPESAFGDAEWLPIRPGTDSAFVQGLLNVAVRENLVDLDFLARHTNAPYLIKADGKPLTEADMVEGGAKNRYAAFDKKTSAIVWRGVEMKDGKAAGFAEDPASELALDWTGDVTTLSGATVRLTTAWNLFMAEVNRYTPEEAAKITGIKADDIVPGTDRTFADVLLTPTVIYSEQVKSIMRDLPIKGMVHITGGGFYDNIPRVLPEGTRAVIDADTDVVPMFQIDGDVLQRHVVEDDRVARPAAIVAGRDVAHGDRTRTGVVGAALVRGEDDRLVGAVARHLDFARKERHLLRVERRHMAGREARAENLDP